MARRNVTSRPKSPKSKPAPETIPFTKDDHRRLQELTDFFNNIRTLFDSHEQTLDGMQIVSVLRPAVEALVTFDDELEERWSR